MLNIALCLEGIYRMQIVGFGFLPDTVSKHLSHSHYRHLTSNVITVNIILTGVLH